MSEAQACRARLHGDAFDNTRSHSYIALDVPDAAAALQIVDDFGDIVSGYKVGLQLFHAAGLPLLDALLTKGKRIFLDAKLHDIPNTVAGALRAIGELPIDLVNVHALGGRQMLVTAREAIDKATYHPRLVAVTMLTSMSQASLAEIGVPCSATQWVLKLAELAYASGLDGVVASAQELRDIYAVLPRTFATVVPGTRLQGAARHDQARSATPREAMAAGCTDLVIGRAVLQAADRFAALEATWLDMVQGFEH